MKNALCKSLDLKKVDESYPDALKTFLNQEKLISLRKTKSSTKKNTIFYSEGADFILKLEPTDKKKTERFANQICYQCLNVIRAII